MNITGTDCSHYLIVDILGVYAGKKILIMKKNIIKTVTKIRNPSVIGSSLFNVISIAG